MPAAPLPLLTALRASYGDVFRDFPAFLRTSWLIWLLLVLLVEVPSYMLAEQLRGYLPTPPSAPVAEAPATPPAADTTAPTPAPAPEAAATAPATTPPMETDELGLPVTQLPLHLLALSFLLNLIQLCLLFHFALRWYRMLLLDEKRGGTIGFGLSRQDGHFIWVAAKAGMALVPFLFVGVSLVGVSHAENVKLDTVSLATLTICIIGMLVAYTRFTLCAPHAALAIRQHPLRDSWRLTHGNMLKILAGDLGIVLPMAGVIVALSLLVSWAVPASWATAEIVKNGQGPITIFLRGLGIGFALLISALLAAFHARVYPYALPSLLETAAVEPPPPAPAAD